MVDTRKTGCYWAEQYVMLGCFACHITATALCKQVPACIRNCLTTLLRAPCNALCGDMPTMRYASIVWYASSHDSMTSVTRHMHTW